MSSAPDWLCDLPVPGETVGPIAWSAGLFASPTAPRDAPRPQELTETPAPSHVCTTAALTANQPARSLFDPWSHDVQGRRG